MRPVREYDLYHDHSLADVLEEPSRVEGTMCVQEFENRGREKHTHSACGHERGRH